jgi:hypothetical protein
MNAAGDLPEVGSGSDTIVARWTDDLQVLFVWLHFVGRPDLDKPPRVLLAGGSTCRLPSRYPIYMF